jgi:hypothetical protein
MKRFLEVQNRGTPNLGNSSNNNNNSNSNNNNDNESRGDGIIEPPAISCARSMTWATYYKSFYH